jgi:hypothetical protein
MNSLWDSWFVDPFLSEKELKEKYGPRCVHCSRHMMKFPYCRCNLIFGEDGQFDANHS